MPVQWVCFVCELSFVGRKNKQYICPACSLKTNPNHFNAFLTQRRLALKENLPATLTWKEWQQTRKDFANMCAYCERRPARVIEHFVPRKAGGGFCRENCLPACSACNWRKGGKIIDKTTFSPLTIERLHYYLICRKQGRIIRGEQLDEEWQCFLPPTWRREGDWQFSPRSPNRVRWNVEHIMRPGPLSPTLLATLREAEHWEQSLTDLSSPHLLMAQRICWAVISDEATRLIHRAEETLSEEELFSLRQKADSHQGDLWLRYRARPSQVKALIERSLSLQNPQDFLHR